MAFRETILQTCDYDFWHRKQSGGRGEYARVIGRVEPLPAANNTVVEFKARVSSGEAEYFVLTRCNEKSTSEFGKSP